MPPVFAPLDRYREHDPEEMAFFWDRVLTRLYTFEQVNLAQAMERVPEGGMEIRMTKRLQSGDASDESANT